MPAVTGLAGDEPRGVLGALAVGRRLPRLSLLLPPKEKRPGRLPKELLLPPPPPCLNEKEVLVLKRNCSKEPWTSCDLNWFFSEEKVLVKEVSCV